MLRYVRIQLMTPAVSIIASLVVTGKSNHPREGTYIAHCTLHIAHRTLHTQDCQRLPKISWAGWVGWLGWLGGYHIPKRGSLPRKKGYFLFFFFTFLFTILDWSTEETRVVESFWRGLVEN